MAAQTRQWLFQDRQVMTRWGRRVHASMVETGTEAMVTMCGRPVARDADLEGSDRRCAICFPAATVNGRA